MTTTWEPRENWCIIDQYREAIAAGWTAQMIKDYNEAVKARNGAHLAAREARDAQAKAEAAAENLHNIAAAEQGTRTYVRLGRLPQGGRSRNHRDNYYEAGVSVYAAWMTDSTVYVDLRGGVSVGVLMFSTASRYEVAGVELDETGSDGEPLLTDARVIQCLDDIDLVVIR